MITDPDAPPAKIGVGWKLTLAGLERLPQGLLSRMVGRLADIPVPRFLRRPLYGGFARMVGIDLDEVERPLVAFATFDAFFVRKLREGVHDWPSDPSVLTSPVDGVVGACGTIDEGTAIQAKGRSYRVSELLGDEEQAAAYGGGLFLTLYLSPRHYHRIHTPTEGRVTSARHLPGLLLPVNEAAVALVDQLFARNERLCCTVDGPLGSIAVVAVGATNVGRITVSFDDEWGTVRGVTNQGAQRRESGRRYQEPPAVGQGDELMAFHLGSTVVLLTEPGLHLAPGLRAGREVRVGEPLARRPPDSGVS
ncbi:MAG: archaetidylserine decarboxylase [Gemmatimonadota bacterium]